MHNRMLAALLEEYEKAADEYKNALMRINQDRYEAIADKTTTNKDCESIKSLTFHIVQSGYTYANYIRSNINDIWLEYQEDIPTVEAGILEIDKMLSYTAKALTEASHYSDETIRSWVYNTRWGVTYDFEQLLEHAIVHILRHRRQVIQFTNQLQKHGLQKNGMNSNK